MNKLENIIENYINGNLKDCRRLSNRVNVFDLIDEIQARYGYSTDKAVAIARYIKTGEGYQAACDAE